MHLCSNILPTDNSVMLNYITCFFLHCTMMFLEKHRNHVTVQSWMGKVYHTSAGGKDCRWRADQIKSWKHRCDMKRSKRCNLTSQIYRDCTYYNLKCNTILDYCYDSSVKARIEFVFFYFFISLIYITQNSSGCAAIKISWRWRSWY